MAKKLEKTQTGIASEYYVGGELSRLGYNVTISFGNTKSIDLMIQKDHEVFQVQVKGIQSTESICWNVDKTKIIGNLYFVFVNLHVNHPEAKPEFFVMTGEEVNTHFKDTNKAGKKRTWLDYSQMKKLKIFENRWSVFGEPEEVHEAL